MLALVFVTPSVTSAEGGCYVTCVSESCQLSRVDSRAEPNAASCNKAGPKMDGTCTLREGEAALLSTCRRLAVNAGNVIAYVRSQGHAAKVRAAAKTRLNTALAKYARLECFSGETGCSGRAATGVLAGRAFDPASSWEPYGEPCGMGLPCETIRVPPGKWHFRVLDPAQQGQLHFSTTRGQPRKHTAVIESGAVELPAGWIQAGQTYRYQLVSRDGRLLAAGEFRTVSSQAQRTIDASLAEAAKQSVHLRSAALVESLLEDGLDWDALQLTVSDPEQR
jgi:hypothetical protein